MNPNSKRSYKRRIMEPSADEVLTPVIREAISWMDYFQGGGEHDIARVAASMAKTFDYRRAWIREDKPSVDLILSKFKKFKEMPSLVRTIIHSTFFLNMKLIVFVIKDRSRLFTYLPRIRDSIKGLCNRVARIFREDTANLQKVL
jgi:hypothetical protein